MKFSELVKEAHATAVEKGWHEGKEKTIDRAAALLLLVHDEVTEAWEASTPNDTVGEVSDILIRVADAYGFFGWEYEDFDICKQVNIAYYNRGSAGIHAFISTHGTRPLRKTGKPAAVFAHDLDGLLVRWLWGEYRTTSATLLAAIEQKLAFNKTRSYRHGNKLL